MAMSQAPSTRNTTTYIHPRKVTIVAPSPKHTSRVICITPKKCTRRDIPQLVATLCRNVAYGSGRCVNSVPRDPPNLGRKCTTVPPTMSLIWASRHPSTSLMDGYKIRKEGHLKKKLFDTGVRMGHRIKWLKIRCIERK